ncbi:MAG TPA: DUF1876 domain-containing protein [Nocardioidaceae bacterium]|nr:DUF1876 domain-containing protein [Nocardioidaceae bacterium]
MSMKTWTVQIILDEEGNETQADAVLDLQGKSEVRGHGTSHRNPTDLGVPIIGDELAVARALSDLARRLLDSAAGDIESSTQTPASPHL